ncbi:S41 family peptidase [Chitinophaga sp. Cy-1792]|uniref:S41 family peptidase n=1 Tax=Chitinophaga sp. Cy-1792 TaxID=2608339 RepID=UPI00141DDA00|nr:S41 family peptidase [Chitinophaga sp. Cy-1792]NIG52383.1 PDZ domain-containing protein [Chitinophaga sp. Cy-1792]
MRPNLTLRLLTAFALLSLCFAACKKDMATNSGGNKPSSGIVSFNDSIFDVFKDIYLWTDAVPDSATFKPDSYPSAGAMFDSLIGFKKDANGANLDRYSFIDDGTTSKVLSGQAGDMGFQVGYQTSTELRVVYVYPGSPADKAGIKRGWQVTSVNGTTTFGLNTATYTILDNAFSASSATFIFKKPDGTSQTSTLAAASYSLNPVLYSHSYTLSGVNVGYLVFNTFVQLSVVQPELDSIFGAWKTAGVNNVIIDLRYNGGGYAETAEYIANKLAPTTVANSLMYTAYFNTGVTNGTFGWLFKTMKATPNYPNYFWTDIYHSEATTYAKTNFAGTTGFFGNGIKLTFLVTHNTVSASELLYNVLIPSMSPKLVGSQTYGKPTGFIDINFGTTDMFAVCMQNKNSAGNGDYFSGFSPNISVLDDYTNDWGSFSDPLLKAALLDMGVPASVFARQANVESTRSALIPKFYTQGNKFQGTIQKFKRN